MLDISIPNIDRYLKNRRLNDFLNQDVTVTQKHDGVKVTLVRNDKPWSKDYRKNWILAFKGRILYPKEFDHVNRNEAKHGIGISQFCFIFDHLKKIHNRTLGIPKNTEFFIEFIQNKPTITRNYECFHDLVLLAYSPIEYSAVNGILKTYPKEFNRNIQGFADILKTSVPRVVFNGKLNTIQNIQQGLQVQQPIELKSTVNSTEYLNQIKELFCSIPSPYGGVEEGVVIDNGELCKIVQPNQYSKELRKQKKAKYQCDDEFRYWCEVHAFARTQINEKSFNETIERVYTGECVHHNPAKTKHQVREDLHLTCREYYLRTLPNNNNALIVGKFRVLTKAHQQMIQTALNEYNQVQIAVVTSRDSQHTKELKHRMIKQLFPDVEIIDAQTGNLFTILGKCAIIKDIIAGSDRYEGYQSQLGLSSIQVRHYPRTDQISATNALLNYNKFDDYVPQELLNMKDEIWRTYASQ